MRLFFFVIPLHISGPKVYGVIPLQGCQLSVGEDSDTSFSLIAPDRVYYLRAPSPEECVVWLQVLREQTLGTVNRFDEDDDNPEKMRAKKQFSSVAVVASSPPQQSTKLRGFGESIDDNPSILASVVVGGGSQDYKTRASSSEYASRSAGGRSPMESERRFFERVGMPPPSPEFQRTIVRDSDSEFVSESETDDERANLLGQVASGQHVVKREGGSKTQPRKSQEDNDGDRGSGAEEEGNDCCCTIL